MTLTYDKTNNELSITSDHIATYLANTTLYTIDILIDDVSVTTAPTVNPHIEIVTEDILLEVIIKLTTIATNTTVIEKGCIMTDNTLYCKAVELSTNNENINLLIDYFLFSKANECPCECDKLKELFDNFLEQINDCKC